MCLLLPRCAVAQSPLAWARYTGQTRGTGAKRIANTDVRSPAERHVAMTWAQRLERVFNIDIEVCDRCGGSVKVIACIEGQERYRPHPGSSSREATRQPYPAAPDATFPGTSRDIASFRRKRIRNHKAQPATTLLKNAWHGLLHAIVQE